MATVTLSHLGKSYAGSDLQALSNLDLEIEDGEFLVLVGPSGCGKSTALKIVAGLEEASEGTIRIGDQVVNDFASRDRDIAMVFQSYALYPHLSVYDNIAFPLQIAKAPKAEIDRRVAEVAKILQLEPYLKRKPGRLSGGQRQRVAMGRAIIRRPSVFLMDEPLSNLDAKLRVQMRSEIAQIQRRLNVTTIYVTHDQVEAMTMGDRVALMRDGVLQQVGAPDVLYHQPANTFVASFIGSPAMNLFRAPLVAAEGGLALQIGSQRLAVPAEALARYPKAESFAGREVIFGIRPEDIEDASLAKDHPADQCLDVPLRLVESLGSDHMAHVALPVAPVRDGEENEEGLDHVSFEAAGEAEANCICRFGARSKAHAGSDVRVAVSCTYLHFFDPVTGEAL
ncbi:ABC transporter ATP-binding protein [Pseudoruegeria sp. SHC-113]|uniref:ABC transporter ATP-binding protein n=1 Tax=Pseudoruegeria sp. SHC-113 TaxID=2855439 RepID=UPI0021BB630D|nr:sn-glycerol-3-phosphate ABC transporter ATP-binding protein UgpC [Pseudoruegeria sp. SHC-113]MCT8159426.1 sn-glycerol-3-phosphate ABC transporter ATP-binding protein UgpC [Pseudoruegeria sp. SHC-113]